MKKLRKIGKINDSTFLLEGDYIVILVDGWFVVYDLTLNDEFAYSEKTN